MATSTAAAGPVLAVRGLVKRFPGVVALSDVSFDLRAGEVHALCGENGAGKSTLIKIVSGLYPRGAYEGELWVDGRPAAFRSVRDAEKCGISVIYQELALVEEMSVAENIFLGAEPTRRGLVNWEKVHHDARTLLRQFRIDIDPASRVRDLGVGQKQLVEIAKALSKQSRILILDEPTGALTEAEVGILLGILSNLRDRGIACIYISHKLEEVLSIADRVTVLRDGRSVVTLPRAGTDKSEIIRHMVGREITEFFPRRATPRGACLLEVRGLTVASRKAGPPVLQDVAFDVFAGEVLGIGGLMGAGRTELLMHLFGAYGHRLAGRVLIDGRPFAAGPDEAIASGVALVSEDRKRYGLIPDKPIGFNLSLSSMARLTGPVLIDAEREFQSNKRLADFLRIKAPTLETLVGQLSGGNQQKVVLGKALMTEPKVVFLDEPTRGIDVGAKVEVYELMNRLTESGKAVVLVSSELLELMGMSDRILMLHEGRVGGTFPRSEATQEKLLAAAMGLIADSTSRTVHGNV